MIADIEGARLGLKAFVAAIVHNVNEGQPFYINDLDKMVLEFVPMYKDFTLKEKSDFDAQVFAELQELTGVQDFGFPPLYGFYLDNLNNTVFYLSKIGILHREFKKVKIPLRNVRMY